MDLDLHHAFEVACANIEESGKDYADKKARAWQSEELKHAVLAQIMKKLPSDWPMNRKEAEARCSEDFLKYLRETTADIKAEGVSKAVYERRRAEFEALRSLTSLEKSTRQIVG